MTPEGELALDWCLWLPFIFLVCLHFWVFWKRWPKNGGYSFSLRRHGTDVCLLLLTLHVITRLALESYAAHQQIKYRKSPTGVPVPVQITILKTVYADGFMYSDILWLVKLTFLSMFYRIWKSLSRAARIFFHINLAFIIISYMMSFFSLLFYCLPISRNWALDKTYCSLWQFWGINFAGVLMRIASDIIVMILGWLVIRRLQLSRGQVRGTYLIFVLGGITMCASAIRIAVFTAHPATDAQGFEFQALGTIFSEFEASLSSIAACLPSLRVFLRSYTHPDSAFSSEGKKSTGHSFSLGQLSSGGTSSQRGTGEESSVTRIIPDGDSKAASVDSHRVY